MIPNPAGDFVTMKFTNDEEVGKGYFIKDMAGRVVFKSNAAFSSGETIDISSFAAGIYIVKVLFDNGATSTQKLIKL